MSEKNPKKWTTVKIPEGTYEALKKMGLGISGAIQVLVESQQRALEMKMGEIEETGREIANILMESGFFNVKFLGGNVTSVNEKGSVITVHGYFAIDIPNEEARQKIIEKLRGEENEEN